MHRALVFFLCAAATLGGHYTAGASGSGARGGQPRTARLRIYRGVAKKPAVTVKTTEGGALVAFGRLAARAQAAGATPVTKGQIRVTVRAGEVDVRVDRRIGFRLEGTVAGHAGEVYEFAPLRPDRDLSDQIMVAADESTFLSPYTGLLHADIRNLTWIPNIAGQAFWANPAVPVQIQLSEQELHVVRSAWDFNHGVPTDARARGKVHTTEVLIKTTRYRFEFEPEVSELR